MLVERQDGLSALLQFVALALPAVVIYLQVLISIHRTEGTVEIDGRAAKAVDSGGTRKSENDPNVIEALPELMTEADSQLGFGLALASLAFFLFAALALTIRLLVALDDSIVLGTSLAVVAIILFVVSVTLKGWNSVKLILYS